MLGVQNIIVMQDRSGLRDSLVQELAEWEFTVRSCGGILGFCQLYATQSAPVVVLVGMRSMLDEYATAIRKTAKLAAIVVLGADINAQRRVRIMRAGADACHEVSLDICELSQILGAWGRHASAAMTIQAAWVTFATAARAVGPRPWCLSANRRVLASPHGRTLTLTGLEAGFLAHLATSDGQLIRRHTPCATLGNLQGGDRLNMHSLGILVSRLRRKARHAGIDLPLLAVRGCGYLFAECLDMSPTTRCKEIRKRQTPKRGTCKADVVE